MANRKIIQGGAYYRHWFDKTPSSSYEKKTDKS